MFRQLRILILLVVLATVGLGAWRANLRLTSWQDTVNVAVYPVAGDDSPATARFLSELGDDSFADIGEWMQEQTRRYGKTVLKPVVISVAPTVNDRPPVPPGAVSAADAVAWSLKLRWWASQHDRIEGVTPRVRLFVVFHDPERTPMLSHSTGLSKGAIGVVHVFASRLQRRQNSVIIAHEMLHIFGASDKYDLATSLPIYPQGYAEPQLDPRLPQKLAEIMGGRIPVSERQAEIPDSLGDTLIGADTAREIGFLK